MTDKEKADKLRAAAGILEDLEGFGEYAEVLKASAEKLDPPRPEWPDGTIAAVTYTNLIGNESTGYLARRNGVWCYANGLAACRDDAVTKVEPLRVLADDEIALPVVSRSRDALARDASVLDRESGFAGPGAAVLRAYVRALESACEGQP